MYTTGVKSYPRGVTTNSDGGIESYETYYPVFEAMEAVDMVLNLHGEIPSDAATNTCVLNAEPAFLPHLRKLHARFPRLRIVLEHATTRAAVECVRSLGPTVACTITAHHLALTVDDWAGQAWNFCKPVAKFPDDRQALRDVVKEGACAATDLDALTSSCHVNLQATRGSSSGPTLPLTLPTQRLPRRPHSRAPLACIHRRSSFRWSHTCSIHSTRSIGWRVSSAPTAARSTRFP